MKVIYQKILPIQDFLVQYAMVKNLSNPLNARKVAQILAQDTEKAGFNIREREISVFLSDNRISDLPTALKQLKHKGVLPSNYEVSDSCQNLLVEEEFLMTTGTLSQSDGGDIEEGLALIEGANIDSIEFNSQLESLKNKLIKSWSGGISIEGNELDNFNRKFTRPMEAFKTQMQETYGEISDLQAFAVIYATDHLSIGDNSKEEVYNLMFGRFDKYREELKENFGFQFTWPNLSGTSFIEIGKKFSIVAELTEFAKKFRSISGLDTYPDAVIQVFFFQLITGSLIDEMIEKKLLFRWAEKGTTFIEPLKWLIPPSEYNIDNQFRELLTQGVITHTLLQKIEKKSPNLIEILIDIKDLDRRKRSAVLAKRVEAALTRKSVAIQFGTTLANFFENFKTNPSNVTPFLDTADRYFLKTEHVSTLITTIEHNIRTALKNSTGIIKKYLKQIGDEELVQIIQRNVTQSLNFVVLSKFDDNSELIGNEGIDRDQLDKNLRLMEEPKRKEVFAELFNQLFILTNKFAKSLEPEKIEPKSNAGGLNELTQDFISTINYHGSKDYQTKKMIDTLIQNGIETSIAELICYSSSYITYQIASKEGNKGERMLSSLVKNYEQKAKVLGEIQLTSGKQLKGIPLYSKFIKNDLTQAHALVSLASKIKIDAFNAWTPLESIRSKSVLFFNEMIIPNLLYWQRQPREFIMSLVKNNLIEKSQTRELVVACNRLNLIEAYCLLIMGSKATINSFEDARHYLSELFDNQGELTEKFNITPRSGEAEISLEASYLWSHLQEVA